MRLQLEVLAKWLKDYKEPFNERDGALESAMNRAKEETMFQIGDYLEEILEMNPDQLWDTTMDPEKRTMLRVEMEDAEMADEIFSVLMGSNVDPRKLFIEKYAKDVRWIDV